MLNTDLLVDYTYILHTFYSIYFVFFYCLLGDTIFLLPLCLNLLYLIFYVALLSCLDRFKFLEVENLVQPCVTPILSREMCDNTLVLHLIQLLLLLCLIFLFLQNMSSCITVSLPLLPCLIISAMIF